MNHQHTFQTYTLGELMFLVGSFRINGTSDPDNKRDGRSGAILSVERESAGLFTVTFDEGFLLPEKLIVDPIIGIGQDAAPTAAVRPHYVKDSYSYVTRSFQIQTLDMETPAATDPDDDDTISFFACGSISSAGTDTTT